MNAVGVSGMMLGASVRTYRIQIAIVSYPFGLRWNGSKHTPFGFVFLKIICHTTDFQKTFTPTFNEDDQNDFFLCTAQILTYTSASETRHL